jgi:hypothetical protein
MLNPVNKNYVMVIGSKPEARLSKIIPYKIYAANGALERAMLIKKKNSQVYVISVVGNPLFNYISLIEKIKECKPNELITTNGKIDLKEHFETKFLHSISYRYLEKKGINLQKKYFSNLNLRLADFGLIFTSGNLLYGILRLIYNILIKKRAPMGLSTGCLSILLALIENKLSKVIVTGISLEGGEHFYQSNRSLPAFRGWADAYLVKRLPIDLKSRIVTTDKNFSKNANVQLIK